MDSTDGIDVLPDEIFAVIFKLVADSPITSLETDEPFPLAASRVSRRWRAVTLASPEIWATVRFTRRSCSWKLANAFIERTGSYPLDISVGLEPYTRADLPPPRTPASNILAVIGPHIHRWRKIPLCGSKRYFADLRQFMHD
ncbi:hypothetical protein B0H17DRAFT_1247518, partial [Mycena rosella]